MTISNPMDYKAALYIRLSKEDGDKKESESVTNQRAILEKYARDNSLAIVETYVDDGFSGANFERPDFKRMTQDIEDGKINLVIVKDLSRFGRNRVRQEFLVCKYSEDYGVRFIAVNDEFDTADENNELVFMMKNWSNEQFIKETSKKIKATKRYKQEQGLFIGGKAPYGYKKSPDEKNRIIIDESAAEVVRKIFQLALAGESCRKIAMVLNEQNIPTPASYAGINLSVKGPYSGKWSAERISFMLRNEVYIGSMVQGRVEKVSYKNKKCRKLPPEEWTVVENTHEAIIDKHTFQKVGLLIQSRNHTRSRTHDYLLKGIIYCHECGYPLGVINRKLSGNRQMLYFICRTYQRFTKYQTCTCHCMRVEDVTKAVLARIREVCKHCIQLLNMDEITDEANQKLQAEKKRQEKDVVDIRARLAAVNAQIDKTYSDRLSGMVEDDVFQRAYNRLKEEHESLQKKVKLLENSDDDEILFNREKVKEIVENFVNTEEYSRELIVSLIERIELTANKEVLIFFRFKELKLTNPL